MNGLRPFPVGYGREIDAAVTLLQFQVVAPEGVGLRRREEDAQPFRALAQRRRVHRFTWQRRVSSVRVFDHSVRSVGNAQLWRAYSAASMPITTESNREPSCGRLFLRVPSCTNPMWRNSVRAATLYSGMSAQTR